MPYLLFYFYLEIITQTPGACTLFITFTFPILPCLTYFFKLTLEFNKCMSFSLPALIMIIKTYFVCVCVPPPLLPYFFLCVCRVNFLHVSKNICMCVQSLFFPLRLKRNKKLILNFKSSCINI